MLGHDVRAAMEDQVLNQAARKILQNVRAARNDHATSARRWVWELLQNAVDSTAESGDDVDVEVALAGDWLTFQHAGGPFSTENLGALITGGSSKPLQSARYTGQFGSARGSGTGPILLSQATFLLAHIANSGPVPLPASCPASRFLSRFPLPYCQ